MSKKKQSIPQKTKKKKGKYIKINKQTKEAGRKM